MTWNYTSELFDDLAKRGLITGQLIEDAYLQDDILCWRLVSSLSRVVALDQINERDQFLSTFLTDSDFYKPFFKRWSVSEYTLSGT